jgi:predicted alpha/beta superfamily hydrolase
MAMIQTVGAQPIKASASIKPFTLGITDQVHSAILNEDRALNIYFPKGYNPHSDTLYPVIYLLDGGADEDFIHIVGLVQFLTGIVDTMPPCIVVGIANTDRKRDMTFPTTVEKDKKAYPTTGGSEKFISFIEKELQPYIEKKYRAGQYKVLVGQSLGGLLATEVLLKKPWLFSAYLIVSPSLWWDNESLLALAPKLLSRQSDDQRHVFIAVGSKEEDQMVTDAKKLADILRASGQSHLKVDYVPMPAENHLTILHNAAYKGFEVLFAK